MSITFVLWKIVWLTFCRKSLLRISLQCKCKPFRSPFLPPLQPCSFLGLSLALVSELVRMYNFSQTNTICPAIHYVTAALTLCKWMGFGAFDLSHSGQDLWFSYFDSNQAENSWHSHNFKSIKIWLNYVKLFLWHNMLPKKKSKEKYLEFFLSSLSVRCLIIYIYLSIYTYFHTHIFLSQLVYTNLIDLLLKYHETVFMIIFYFELFN